ncbi:MAG: hypothetical protein KA314_03230 [Chloroflexi bacterium]|nr:hypothetical protein [Chloroflexota bacterium]MBP8054824.1 hypothetical protein [Chloroflexota bacterium]
MHVNFFEDPLLAPKAREDVRFNRLGMYVYPDRRRVAVGFDITPFLERPSLEVNINNDGGQRAASLNVIETNESNFSLTMHLRDQSPTDVYHVQIILYYAKPGEEKLVVDQQSATFTLTLPGDQIIYQIG